MLSAVPRRRFSWDFTLQDSSRQPVAEVVLSSWRERGSISVAGIEYKLRRHGARAGPFVLEGGGSEVARAIKPSAFRREFTIIHDERQYTLKRRSALRRGCALFLEDKEIGSIRPEAWFSRRARVDLPDELPLLLRAFVVWLTMLLWKRDSDAEVTASAI